MRSQTPNHVLHDINIHDVLASKKLDCLRLFLFSECNTNALRDEQSPLRSTTDAAASLLTQKLSRSPSATSGFKSGTAPQWVPASELNRKDLFGRTLLHKLASSDNESDALSWMRVLVQHPSLNINATDDESGWTALHRALYQGNLRFAKVLIDELACGVDIKDHEGLSAFDLYNLSIDGSFPSTFGKAHDSKMFSGRTDLFTWGSNRNFVLGIENDGDKLHPDRIHLKRLSPSTTKIGSCENLRAPLNSFSSTPINQVAISKLHTAIVTTDGELRVCGFGSGGRLGLNNNLTREHSENMNPAAETQFTFASVNGGSLQGQRVASIALGQDHTVVVTDNGQVHTFGMNQFGQLGYTPEGPGSSTETSQVEPKRVLGILKKELVIGATASRWHTAVFTSDGLYTWGAHRGQLGYHGTPSSSKLSAMQMTPKRVHSVNSPVSQLSSTNYSTAYLCKTSNDVFILRADSSVRISFPMDRFPCGMQAPSGQSHHGSCPITKINASGDTMIAISSTGDAFAIDLENSNPPDPNSSSGLNSYGVALHNASSRPIGSHYHPRKIWTSINSHSVVTSAAVGAEGSVILSTACGHVYLGTRRQDTGGGANKSFDSRIGDKTGANFPRKSHKFHRVPHLQRVTQVAANSTGSYAAIREDAFLDQIQQLAMDKAPNLTSALLTMLPHLKCYASSVPQVLTAPLSSTSLGTLPIGPSPGSTAGQDDADEGEGEDEALEWDVRVGCALFALSLNWNYYLENQSPADGDLLLLAGTGEPVIVHRFVICSRSSVIDKILNHQHKEKDIAYYPPGSSQCKPFHQLPALQFPRCSLLSLLLLVHYFYSDNFPCLWDSRVWPRVQETHGEFLGASTSKTNSASRLQVLTEIKGGLSHLAKVAQLPYLISSLDRFGKCIPQTGLAADFHRSLLALQSSDLQRFPKQQLEITFPLSSNLEPDMELELQGGEILACHSFLMRAQCPFFHLMFDNEAWVSARRRQMKASANVQCIRIDMRHLSKRVVMLVLKHIYSDDWANLFDPSEFDSLDHFIDFVFEISAAANELMMDKLKSICSFVLRSCISLNNVTSIASDAVFYRLDSLKDICISYIIHNLEAMFQDKGLISIPAPLLATVSEHLRRAQRLKSPVSRNQEFDMDFFISHSELASQLDLPTSKAGIFPRHWEAFIKSTRSQGKIAPSSLRNMSLNKSTVNFVDESGYDHSKDCSPLLAKLSAFELSSSPVRKQLLVENLKISSPNSPLPKLQSSSPVAPPLEPSENDPTPFRMDDLDDNLASSKATDSGQNLPANPNRSAWGTPANKTSRVDLRSIMSAEKTPTSSSASCTIPGGDSPSSAFPRYPTTPDSKHSFKPSQREKKRQSQEATRSLQESGPALGRPIKMPAWKSPDNIPRTHSESARRLSAPPADSTGAALSASIGRPLMMVGIEVRTPTSTPGQSSAVKSARVVSLPLPPAAPILRGSPVRLSPKKPELSDPASAVGAVVITPGRAPSTSNAGGSILSTRRSSGGQDTPWTNYASSSSSQLQTSFSSIDYSYGSAPVEEGLQGTKTEDKGKTKFAMIQNQQENESSALRSKVKPSLTKIQEEENLRQQEKKQEEQFLKWFEEESKRIKQEQQRSNKQKGSKRGGGHKDHGAQSGMKSGDHVSSSTSKRMDSDVEKTGSKKNEKTNGSNKSKRRTSNNEAPSGLHVHSSPKVKAN